MSVKSQRLISFVTVSALSLLACSVAASDTPFSRAMYGEWNASQLADVGFEALIVPINCRSHGGILTVAKEESLQAAGENVTFILREHYDGNAFEAGDPRLDFEYDRVVTRHGFKEAREPSPVDEVYWREWIERCTLFVANLSLHYPIWGMVWDMEPYRRSDEKRWKTDMYSYDVGAFHGFANDTGRAFPEVAADQRHRFLSDRGLVQEYQLWQERKLYEMARTTAERAHAINPNLSLGVLWFQQTWIVWNVLRGFNCSTAPATAWSEQCYEGYNTLDYQGQKRWWSANATTLNGVLIPGFWTVKLDPFDMIENMERAARDEGLMWIYQHHDPFQRADEASYVKAYQLVDRFIFFNRSRPRPLPETILYPKVKAKPYLGPSGIGVMLESHHLSDEITATVEVLTNASLLYFGENLTVIQLTGKRVSHQDLPCLIAGLSREDLLATEVRGMLQELELLIDIATSLSIRIEGCVIARENAVAQLEGGNQQAAKTILESATEEAYTVLFRDIMPLLEDPPSEREVPPARAGILISVADRLMSEGSEDEAEAYLMAGAKLWIPEFDTCWPTVLAIVAFAAGYIRSSNPR